MYILNTTKKKKEKKGARIICQKGIKKAPCTITSPFRFGLPLLCTLFCTLIISVRTQLSKCTHMGDTGKLGTALKGYIHSAWLGSKHYQYGALLWCSTHKNTAAISVMCQKILRVTLPYAKGPPSCLVLCFKSDLQNFQTQTLRQSVYEQAKHWMKFLSCACLVSSRLQSDAPWGSGEALQGCVALMCLKSPLLLIFPATTTLCGNVLYNVIICCVEKLF